ncbi:MAG: protein kinase [Sandaracinaceae bacterium]|nr:protein kinase [Sandaracinaceae bacterium]
MPLHLSPETQRIGRLGKYDVLGRVATGGMAEILLARQVSSHGLLRHVVLKRMLPHAARDSAVVDMFVQEAKLAMHLKHPGICTIYEFGREQGRYFIAMEWVHGVSLASLIERAKSRGGLPLPIAAKIIADVGEALDYAHRVTDPTGHPLGVVHRDVTPENIMISYDGHVKLLDFGVASVVHQRNRTQAGVLKGKFAYMSPEQYKGIGADARSDVFSLGVCLYEAVTGTDLFHRNNEYETVAAIVLDDAVPPPKSIRPDLPPSIDSLVTEALQKDPTLRLESAEAMHRRLSKYLAEQGEVITPTRIGEYVKELFAAEVAAGAEFETEGVEVRGDSMLLQSQRPPRGSMPARAVSPSGRPKPEPPVEPTAQLVSSAEADQAVREMTRARKRRSAFVGIFVFALIACGLVAVVVALLRRP